MLMLLHLCQCLLTGGSVAGECLQLLLHARLSGLSHWVRDTKHPSSIPGTPASMIAGDMWLILGRFLVRSAGAALPLQCPTLCTAQTSALVSSYFTCLSQILRGFSQHSNFSHFPWMSRLLHHCRLPESHKSP